jgi:hypothetical protein
LHPFFFSGHEASAREPESEASAAAAVSLAAPTATPLAVHHTGLSLSACPSPYHGAQMPRGISPHDGPVAVTGCSGFTGGHLVRELTLYGPDCIRDVSTWRGADAVQYLSQLPGVEIVDGYDLFKPGSYYHEAFAGCSAVFHAAAVLGNSTGDQPNGSGDSNKDTYDAGVIGTRNVLDAVEASGSVKRLVYTSSTAAVEDT